jgi:hypothetical protein
MSQAQKPSPGTERPTANAASNDASVREKPSGRVAFDARGNAVWEWRTGDKKFGREVSTTLVQKLEAPELRLATTAIVKAVKDTPADTPAGLPKSFNPYNHAAVDVARSTGTDRPRSKSVVARLVVPQPRTRAGWLQRLREWVGLD